MPPLPTLSGLEIVRNFERFGWRRRVREAVICYDQAREIATLSVPNYLTVAKGTLCDFIRSAGLTGLGDAVMSNSADFRRITLERREGLKGRDIFLPLVLHQHGEGWGELDYQSHILPGIDWNAIESPDPQSSLPDPAVGQSESVDVGDALPVFHPERELNIAKEVQINWFARRLSDVVPNPVASRAPCTAVCAKTPGGRRHRRPYL